MGRRVSTYLNFEGNCEEAFNFYAQAFSVDFSDPIVRFDDMTFPEGSPALDSHEANLVMHTQLEIVPGHLLHGTDMLRSMGHELRVGNNTTISVDFDNKEDLDSVFSALAPDSTERVDPIPQMWGAYWAVLLDRYKIRWMFNAPFGN
ncbi:MAG: VOC family protein [Actinomycetota bacterium]|nr:VOC family protein [Actinomycetota bacterium]